jgi:hypothetical protein
MFSWGIGMDILESLSVAGKIDVCAASNHTMVVSASADYIDFTDASFYLGNDQVFNGHTLAVSTGLTLPCRRQILLA